MMYGFQRLVLLNSAGYQRAEMPLDESVSLIAPNNMGKTSLINALQFLLIIDRRRMDFGAHDFDKSRRFYFPDNSAYILLEATLPDTGAVVLGCVGKGVGYDYEYFAYKGPLLTEEYRCDNGALVTQPNLISHLRQHGRNVFVYSPTAFADIVYGGRAKRQAHEPDFTLFRLQQRSDADAFQRVLTRTLRLDKLRSSDVKAYLLQIFSRELPDATIDFKNVWEKAFAEVYAEREQYSITLKLKPEIEKTERLFEERLTLRGKINVWRPQVNQALLEWHSYFTQTRTDLVAASEQLKTERSQQVLRDRERTLERAKLERQLDELTTADQYQSELALRFALIRRAEQFDEELAAARKALDEQTALVQQGGSRSTDAIRRELQDNARQYAQCMQKQKTLTNNLYQQLRNAIPPENSEMLERLLSQDALTLGPDQFHLVPSALLAFLQQQSDQTIALPGLEVSLQTLPLLYEALTADELAERISELQAQKKLLEQHLQVASDLDTARQRKQQLEKKVRQIEADQADYANLLQLQSHEGVRAKQGQQYQDQLAEIQSQLDQTEATTSRLNQQISDTENEIRRLDEQNRDIDRFRTTRPDQDAPFVCLNDLPCHPWIGKCEVPLTNLTRQLADYQQDCRRLGELNQQLDFDLARLHSAGLTKYQYLDTPEKELQLIIDFSQQLPREAEVLEKKARSAVVNVTASLRELRSGLSTFFQKMREFNRLISSQRLSDLKIFEISPREETHLVGAIDTLLKTAEQVESGQSFELFNQHSVMDDREIDHARHVLIDEGVARQGLRVADLFRLTFKVAKHDGQTEEFEDLDSAASNGTVLMAKLVTGLAMLHLMRDHRYPVRAVCYLDEALALDANNQKSLIATSEKFGFSLIFAAPAPLITARYCVPIHRQNGYNYISRKNWQILEPLESAPHGQTTTSV